MTATPRGSLPTGIVATTVLVAVAITKTVPTGSNPFVTYAYFPSGVIATPKGKPTIGIVATTVLVAVSITETSLEISFAT